MKILYQYLLKFFFPIFITSLLFFVLLLELGDLFANLWKYLSNDVSLKQILMTMVLYFPKCISFSMPIAILFSSSYTLGLLYSRNELISIFTSGFPLHSFILPLLIFGLLLSFAMFFYEDSVVIDSTFKKNNYTKILLKQEVSYSNSNIVIMSSSGEEVYLADYYHDSDQKLYSLVVISRNNKGNINFVLQCPVATWDGNQWITENASVYSFTNNNEVSLGNVIPQNVLIEPPETFKKNSKEINELKASEAKEYITKLRKAGLPFSEHLSNYYERFSFPFTIFIVLFFSVSLGGRFKKNILLMSLLVSLVVAVLFYVSQMVLMLFAKWEYISPLAGAWSSVILFTFAGFVLLKNART